MTASQDRIVLVVTRYGSTTSHWTEWPDKTFAEVTEAIVERAKDKKASGQPSEVLEVQVVRRAVVKADVTVEEVPVAEPDILRECRGCAGGFGLADNAHTRTLGCLYEGTAMPAQDGGQADG